MSSITLKTYEQDNDYVELRWDKYEPHYELIIGVYYNGLVHVSRDSRYTTKEKGQRAFNRQVRKLKQQAEIETINEQEKDQAEIMKKAYKKGLLDYGFKYGNFFNYEKDIKKVCIQWAYNGNIYELIAENLSQALAIIDRIEEDKGNPKNIQYKYVIVDTLKHIVEGKRKEQQNDQVKGSIC